jgi:hypothetical protein
VDSSDQVAREHAEATRSEEREPTVIELMNGPGRPSPERRKVVLWVALTFATFMLLATAAVVSYAGLDLLSLITLGLLLMLVAGMIGALRYKGEDPLAHLDPPQRPQRRRRSRNEERRP